MVKRSKTYVKWVKTAYALFADDGWENFSVKTLAEKSGLPRSSFYYYFDDKDDIINAIIDYYIQSEVVKISEDFKNDLHTFLPDFYIIVHSNKETIKFTKQLFKHKEIDKFDSAHKQGIAISATYIVPKFKEYLDIDLKISDCESLWFTLADAWFSRIDFDNYTVETLSNIGMDIWNSLCLLSSQELKQVPPLKL